MKNSFRVFLTVSVLALAAATAHAQSTFVRGPYVGGMVGQSRLTFDNDAVPISGGGSSTLTRNNETDVGVRAFGGYRFYRNLAVEGGITSFGSFTVTRNTAGGSGKTTANVVGVHVNAVGIVPVDNNFDLFGKAGVLVASTQYTGSSTGSVVLLGETTVYRGSTSLMVGIGAEYRITRHIGVRVEFEQAFGVGDSNVARGDLSFASVGALYRF